MKAIVYSSFLSLLLMIAGVSFAQTNFRSVSNSIVVEGTSTLHDWHMTSATASVAAVIDLDEAGKPKDIQSLTFVLGPTTLKSGKGAMDDNAYKALKIKNFNVIKFAAVNGTVTPAGGANYTIKCQGILTISGKSVNTEVVATATLGGDGSLTCNGSKAIRMTDYGVDPPSFMMGTIKTGNDLTIKFKTVLKK